MTRELTLYELRPQLGRLCSRRCPLSTPPRRPTVRSRLTGLHQTATIRAHREAGSTRPFSAPQPSRWEWLFLPHLRHLPTAARPSQIKSTFRMSRSAAAGSHAAGTPGHARRVCWPLCAWTIRATIRGGKALWTSLPSLGPQEECPWRLSDGAVRDVVGIEEGVVSGC